MSSPRSDLLDRPDSAVPGTPTLWQRLTEPSEAITDLETNRQARLLSSLLVILLPLAATGFVFTFIFGSTAGYSGTIVQGGAALGLAVAYGLSRTRRYYLAAIVTIGVLFIVPFAVLSPQGGYSEEALARGFIWMILPILLSGVLLPFWGTVVVAIAGALGLLALPLFFPQAAVTHMIMPIGYISAVTGLVLLTTRHRSLLERDRQAELVASNRELQALSASLEQRVDERTHELVQRSAYLQATAEVSRAASSILDRYLLARQVVELIRERFRLYYVGLFQLDDTGEWAVLQAGTGQAGQAMLNRGHRLPVGEGMIGWSIAHAEPRVALAAGTDAVRLATPELPDTRSEAALPLRSRGQAFGALTVQHTQPEAFDEATLAVLQTMADQVAIALDNARLFTETQEALEAERRAYGEITREAWAQMARRQFGLGYLCDQEGTVTSTLGSWRPEMIQASHSGQTIQADGSTMAIPIKIRDRVAGVVRLRKPDGGGAWTAQETALMEALTEQLGTALESARLYQDTKRRATRDKLLGEVTARMRETLDMDTVLQTAIREIGQAMGIAEVEVRLGSSQIPGGTTAAGDTAPLSLDGHGERR